MEFRSWDGPFSKGRWIRGFDESADVGRVSHTVDALGFPDSTVCCEKFGLLEQSP